MQTIHLAGTNGKGSTAQYIAEILGVRHSVGLFTSPHIFTPLERFWINGKTISQGEYDALLAGEKEHAGGVWTMFGVWTNMALRWFRERGVAYAVVETGLGGRKDPTNVVDAQMQVITPVSYDHTEYLGNTLEAIAKEKCGIIKRGSVVLSHPQAAEAMAVIRRTCRYMDARLAVLDESDIKVRHAGTDGQEIDFAYEGLRLSGVRLRAAAAVQAQNACAAAMAAWELGVSADEIKAGLEKTEIRGRAQFADGMLLDAAHNPAALDELARTVKRFCGKQYVVALAAVMEDKDVFSIAQKIGGFADCVVTTRADKKRGLAAKEFAGYFSNAFHMEEPVSALEYARQVAARKKGVVVVCGSFYLLPFVMGGGGV